MKKKLFYTLSRLRDYDFLLFDSILLLKLLDFIVIFFLSAQKLCLLLNQYYHFLSEQGSVYNFFILLLQ